MAQAQRSTNPDARFWNRLARKYAADPITDVAGYERTLEAVADHIDATDRVLEIGCGTGTTALHLAKYAKSYLATDIASEMIRIAREKLEDADCSNLTFAVSSGEANIPSGGDFDAVLAFSLLHLVEDFDETLQNIFSMTRPGGVFLSKTPCIRELNPLIQWGLPVARLLRKAPKNIISFTEAELLDGMTRAGFVVEMVERHGTTGKDVRPYVVARRPA